MVRLAHMAHELDTPRVPTFSLGERIRKAREDLGLSQLRFATALGIDRKTVGNWEAGRNQPRYGDLMLISSVTDVSLEWLAGELFRPEFGVGIPTNSTSPGGTTHWYGEPLAYSSAA